MSSRRRAAARALRAAVELDGVRLPRALPAAVGAVRRRALRDRRGRGRTGDTVHTDRGDVSAPLLVDARVAARARRPARAAARGRAEPRPGGPPARRRRRRPRHVARPRPGPPRLRLVGPGAAASAGSARSYDPRDHVKEPTRPWPRALDVEPSATRATGSRTACARDRGTAFCVGDSAGHCFPLSGEGIRTAFYFGIACGRELRAVLAGRRRGRGAAALRGVPRAPRGRRSRAPRGCSGSIPALPPRVLSVLLRAMGVQFLVDRAFGWYLQQAHPALARTRRTGPPPMADPSSTPAAPVTPAARPRWSGRWTSRPAACSSATPPPRAGRHHLRQRRLRAALRPHARGAAGRRRHGAGRGDRRARRRRRAGRGPARRASRTQARRSRCAAATARLPRRDAASRRSATRTARRPSGSPSSTTSPSASTRWTAWRSPRPATARWSRRPRRRLRRRVGPARHADLRQPADRGAARLAARGLPRRPGAVVPLHPPRRRRAACAGQERAGLRGRRARRPRVPDAAPRRRELWVRDKETVIRDADGAAALQPGRARRRHAHARRPRARWPTSATAPSATSTSPARSS